MMDTNNRIDAAKLLPVMIGVLMLPAVIRTIRVIIPAISR